MEHIMIDLETLGTTPGCSILSIGAVFFDTEHGLGSELRTVVHRPSCASVGLFEDADTLAWWRRQSEAARRVLIEADQETVAYSIESALEELNKFCKLGTNAKVWGNGADFDNPILIAAYKATGIKQGWKPYNGRCYRTIKNLYKSVKLERVGVHHDCLDDAKSQALHLIEIARQHKLVLS